MTLEIPRSLGVQATERGQSAGAQPAMQFTGWMLNPAAFEFPVISETVAGAWVENIVRGDPALELACIAAARRLVAKGAVAICATCGFSIRY